jgi:hypothetical protein
VAISIKIPEGIGRYSVRHFLKRTTKTDNYKLQFTDILFYLPFQIHQNTAGRINEQIAA